MNRIKIIFLDIDGVLNNTKTKEKCGYETGIEHCALLLLKRIVETTDAKICLVSSWKDGWFKENKIEQDEMANYLDDRFSEVGLEIWQKTNSIQKRGKEINNFIENLKAQGVEVEQYIILDDEILDYEEEGLTDNLIYTNYLIGLTESDANKAVSKLQTD